MSDQSLPPSLSDQRTVSNRQGVEDPAHLAAQVVAAPEVAAAYRDSQKVVVQEVPKVAAPEVVASWQEFQDPWH